MIPIAMISGLCFAPITTCQMAVIDEVAQPQHRAEAFTWLGTLYGAGVAIGAVVSGLLIAAGGARAAIATACGATLLAWLLATARSGTLQSDRDDSRSLESSRAGSRPAEGAPPRRVVADDV